MFFVFARLLLAVHKMHDDGGLNYSYSNWTSTNFNGVTCSTFGGFGGERSVVTVEMAG